MRLARPSSSQTASRPRSQSLRSAVAGLVLILAGLGLAPVAQGEVFSMTGDMQLFQPSVGFENASRNKTLPNANEPSATVSQTGFDAAAPPATLRIAPDVWRLDGWPERTENGAPAPGFMFRSFPQLPSFAQVSTSFVTTHEAVTFKAGSGAGSIDWCPYNTGCGYFTMGSVFNARIGISPRPDGTQFGGTFELLRPILTAIVWSVPVQDPVNILRIDNPPNTWTAGLTNFRQIVDPRYTPKLYVGGSVTVATTPNGIPNGRIADIGAYFGPALTPGGEPFDPEDYVATGFQMTTGTIVVSDLTPGSPQIDTLSGSDNRTPGGNGNITLVGGAIVHGGSAGNLFFNATRLHMSLPEPGLAIGLSAGLGVLLGLQRLRQRS